MSVYDGPTPTAFSTAVECVDCATDEKFTYWDVGRFEICCVGCGKMLVSMAAKYWEAWERLQCD